MVELSKLHGGDVISKKIFCGGTLLARYAKRVGSSHNFVLFVEPPPYVHIHLSTSRDPEIELNKFWGLELSVDLDTVIAMDRTTQDFIEEHKLQEGRINQYVEFRRLKYWGYVDVSPLLQYMAMLYVDALNLLPDTTDKLNAHLAIIIACYAY